MSRPYTILKNSLCLCAVVYLLGSCTPAPVKTVHKAYQVEIIQMKFHPAELTLQKGDTVVWINRDIVPHDATEEKGRPLDFRTTNSGKLLEFSGYPKVLTTIAAFMWS